MGLERLPLLRTDGTGRSQVARHTQVTRPRPPTRRGSSAAAAVEAGATGVDGTAVVGVSDVVGASPGRGRPDAMVVPGEAPAGPASVAARPMRAWAAWISSS